MSYFSGNSFNTNSSRKSVSLSTAKKEKTKNRINIEDSYNFGINKEDVIKDYIKLTNYNSRIKNENNFDKRDYLGSVTCTTQGSFNENLNTVNRTKTPNKRVMTYPYNNSDKEILINENYFSKNSNTPNQDLIFKLIEKVKLLGNENKILNVKISEKDKEIDNIKEGYEFKLGLIVKERDDYKNKIEKQIEISKDLAEEIIILRSQLDKYFHYRKK